MLREISQDDEKIGILAVVLNKPSVNIDILQSVCQVGQAPLSCVLGSLSANGKCLGSQSRPNQVTLIRLGKPVALVWPNGTACTSGVSLGLFAPMRLV